jgi:hypothetical protein
MRSALMSTTIASPSSISAIGPPRNASGATWPITSPTDPPEKARVGHQRDRDVALAAQRGDPRRRIEQLRHSGSAARALVADHDHVVVGEESGACSSASISWRSLLKTRARPRKTPSRSPPSTPAIFSTAPPSGARFPFSSRSPPVALERLGDGMDHVPVGRGRIEPADLLGKRLAGAGQCVSPSSRPASSSSLTITCRPPLASTSTIE